MVDRYSLAVEIIRRININRTLHLAGRITQTDSNALRDLWDRWHNTPVTYGTSGGIVITDDLIDEIVEEMYGQPPKNHSTESNDSA